MFRIILLSIIKTASYDILQPWKSFHFLITRLQFVVVWPFEKMFYIEKTSTPKGESMKKTVPGTVRQSLFLHCSKLQHWREKLLKNLTSCRAAGALFTLQQIPPPKWEFIKKSNQMQGSSHFFCLHCSKLPFQWENLFFKKTYPMQGGRYFLKFLSSKMDITNDKVKEKTPIKNYYLLNLDACQLWEGSGRIGSRKRRKIKLQKRFFQNFVVEIEVFNNVSIRGYNFTFFFFFIK